MYESGIPPLALTVSCLPLDPNLDQFFRVRLSIQTTATTTGRAIVANVSTTASAHDTDPVH